MLLGVFTDESTPTVPPFTQMAVLLSASPCAALCLDPAHDAIVAGMTSFEPEPSRTLPTTDVSLLFLYSSKMFELPVAPLKL